MLPRLTAKTDRRFLDGALRNYSEARRGLDELATGRPGGTLHPQHIARIASQLAGDDAIFTCDVGLPTVWAARYLAMNGRRRLIGSFWHGSMANAMAQAIGAQAASPGRQVISLSGDSLFLDIDRTGPQHLVPMSETNFSYSGTVIQFVANSQGAITHFLMQGVEGEDRADRKK